jgi:hypothetical protein
MKKKSENLIVIIGNGFDLAHGLKTGFIDFAKYYLEKHIIENVGYDEPTIFSELFIKYFENPAVNQNNLSYSKPEKDSLLNLYKYIVQNKRDKIPEILNISNDWIFSFLLKNKLLGNLFNKMKPNWFDVEQTYYELLKFRFDNGKFSQNNIIELNQNLDEIKIEFELYLKEQIKTLFDKNIYYSFSQHFKSRENVTFINFNYTDSIEHYLKIKDDDDLNIKVIKNIYVHGKIDNDVIFGYGDDTDGAYQQMKNSKEKELLRNFKTYGYLSSNNYRKFLNELSVFENYDCLVIGHSLDTTDKTILNTILDNPKCDNIELLKRSDLNSHEEKKEAHFELHANLSRILKSEVDLREKLIPFDSSVNFPVMRSEDNSIIHQREKELYIEEKQMKLGDPGVY